MHIACESTLMGRKRPGERERDGVVQRAPSPNALPVTFILITGNQPWTMQAEALCRAGLAPCPVCGGGPLPRRAYCLSCDRSGLDHNFAFPGLAVDEAPDWEWMRQDEREKVRFRTCKRLKLKAKRAAKLARRMTG